MQSSKIAARLSALEYGLILICFAICLTGATLLPVNQCPDEFVRNLVFNFINFPVLTVKLPYNSADVESDAIILLQGEVQDNSDVPERVVPGQFTRYTLSIKVEGAYLYDVRVRDNVHVHEVYISNDEFSTGDLPRGY